MNFGSRQEMASARAQNTANSIFEMSGGTTLYEQIFPRFMSSGNYVVQNTGLQTDSDAADPALRLFTNTDVAFVLNEDNFTDAQISDLWQSRPLAAMPRDVSPEPYRKAPSFPSQSVKATQRHTPYPPLLPALPPPVHPAQVKPRQVQHPVRHRAR